MAKTAAKGTRSYWIFSIIGILIMALFPLIPTGGTSITYMGMVVIGAFIGTLFLWSTVGSVWPSILGLTVVGLSGYAGEGSSGFAAVMSGAFGTETVLTVTFSILLFSGIGILGFNKYIAHFFTTLKIQEGRPYVFFSCMMACTYIISGLSIPLTGMFLVFPVVTGLMTDLGYKKGDKSWYTLILGIFLASAVAQPMVPFKGAYIIILGSLETTLGVDLPYALLALFGIIMGILVCALYIVFIKFAVRPDLSKLKALKVSDMKSETLPPLNRNQKAFLIIALAYLFVVMIPPLVTSENIIWVTLNNIGSVGATLGAIAFLEFIRFDDNKPALSTQALGGQFTWGLYFMVPAGSYLAGCVTNSSLGVAEFIQVSLTPIFGDKPVIVFIVMLVALSIILTQFSGNVAAALLLFPIAAAFVPNYPDVNIMAVCIMISYGVFAAVCLPAGSPYSAAFHSRTDLVSFAEIQKMYIPMLVIIIALYSTVGYTLATMFFA